MKKYLILITLPICIKSFSQNLLTPFEKSKGIQTATYSQIIDYYTRLAKTYNGISIKNFDTTIIQNPIKNR